MREDRNLFVTTTWRTGSTWLCDLVSGLMGTRRTFWSRRRATDEKFRTAFRHRGPHVTKMHAIDPRRICALAGDDERNYVLTVTRDVRDAVVSRAFYWRHDPVVARSRTRRLRRGGETPVDRFIRNAKGLSDRQYVNSLLPVCDLRTLLGTDAMYVGFSDAKHWGTTYERLAADAAGELRGLCRFLRIDRSDEAIRNVVAEQSFSRKTGRSQGEGRNRRFRRKGVVGDYRHWLTGESIHRIDRAWSDVTTRAGGRDE
jgi:hypothetical protein